MELTGYGRSTGFWRRSDREEAAQSLSAWLGRCCRSGTAGCNLACSFCQNWDISKSREVARLSAQAAPETIARAGRAAGLRQRCLHLQRSGHLPGICTRRCRRLSRARREKRRGHRRLHLRGAAQALVRWHGRSECRSERLHRTLLRQALRPARSRPSSIRSNISFTKRGLDRDHDAAHPGRETIPTRSSTR